MPQSVSQTKQVVSGIVQEVFPASGLYARASCGGISVPSCGRGSTRGKETKIKWEDFYMPRRRTGSIWMSDGLMYARITYKDEETGKRIDKKRRVPDNKRRTARRIIRAMLAELEREKEGKTLLKGHRTTFSELVAFYIENYAKPTEYDQHGHKVAGLRSWENAQSIARMCEKHFMGFLVKDITYEDIRLLKEKRLATKTYRKGDRTVATVNRELTILNRMLEIARRQRCISGNPMKDGDPLKDSSAEMKRERIFTRDEEERMLALCVGRRAHLYPMLICAFDTGMRHGEIVKLRRRDVDFERGRLFATSYKGRRMKQRWVPITTTRLRAELEHLCDGLWPEERVFARIIKASGKREEIAHTTGRSFRWVMKKAGIRDARWHDIRHTAATRLIVGGLTLTEVGLILGHTDPRTTYRYVHQTEETAQKAREIMEKVQQQGHEQQAEDSPSQNGSAVLGLLTWLLCCRAAPDLASSPEETT